jgi:DNA repair exonuclease SbcCD ATPase subunit
MIERLSETRILRLKLVNFIGIYAGMGLTTFEVDFTKTDKRTIILVGANGSGKTTVQSCLTPFASTFDIRSKIILDGKDGLKEIDIYQDGVVYKIVHHYSTKKNQSFITKVHLDGTEEKLNPAGTTRNFPAIIEEEMGLTENYIKLNKIGSKSENFIDFKSSRRKEFIGDFTPDISPFLAAYANVVEKFSATTKEIRYITDEASKLTVHTTVEKNIQVLQTTIKSLKTKIAKKTADSEKYKLDLEEGEELLTEIDDLTTKHENLQANIEFEQSGISTQNARYNNKLVPEDSTVESIRGEIEKREANSVIYKTTLDEAQIKHAELSQSISSTNDEIARIKKDLSNLTTNSGLREVKELKELLERSTNDLNESVEYLQTIFGDISVDTFEADYEEIGVSDCIAQLTSVINTVANLSSYISINRPSCFEDVIADLPTNLSPLKLVKACADKIQELDELVDTCRDEVNTALENLNARRNEFDVACKAKELASDCSVGNSKCCLYSKISINTTGNKEKLLAPFNKALQAAEAELKEAEASLSYYTSVYDYLTKIFKIIAEDRNTTEESLALIFEQIGEMFEDTSDLDSLDKLVINLPPTYFDQLETHFKTLLKHYNSLEKTNAKFTVVRKTKDKLAGYSSSESTVKLLEKNIDEARQRLIPLKQESETITVQLEEARKKYEAVSKAITAYRNVLDHLSNIAQYEMQSKTISKSITQLTKQSKSAMEARTKLTGIAEELQELETELEEHEENLSKERLDLVRIKEFAERKEILELARIRYSLIKDSLDIKTGIPLVLVGSYLTNIREATNKLLHVAFKGKFYIDFEISDKDFMIPVYKAGRKSADDILECSQGEVALVKTSLSMGIIAEAIKNLSKQYNVISLDEIDSELDHTNKLVFLDIFNKQLDALHSVQCFIITHNDCFFNSSAALMIFPGAKVDTTDAEFMSNKDILFQA